MGATDRRLERLDPFELKDQLIALARASAKRRGTGDILNAGRGNPDWLALEPREAFFELGRFAMAEARRAPPAEGLGGAPRKRGVARRLRAHLARQSPSAGTRFLGRALRFATRTLGCDAEALVHGACGDHYPEPVRMLVHAERLMRRFLEQEVFAGRRGGSGLDLFAVEGASAGVCYLFDALLANGLLRRGDRIAVAVPVFSPYLEIPQLERYDFDVVRIDASARTEHGAHTWQYPDAEIDKVADPKVKALVLVNPSNPPSVAMAPATLERLVRIVRRRRPGLIVVTDDVYATFVEGFRSVLAALPRNTIGVYSFSKHFGCTGWRLGVLALHEDNVIDAALRRRSSGRRYASLLLEPRRLKFIDRLVADSRAIAFNHTAGLSTPQQVQMALFALDALLDTAGERKRETRAIVRRRFERLYRGVGLPPPEDALLTHYYATLDIPALARGRYGPGFAAWLLASHEPIDFVVRLAEERGIVLLDGGGFDAPAMSVRVSLANLLAEYHAHWCAQAGGGGCAQAGGG
jgi:aspartate 4-decarboxylase